MCTVTFIPSRGCIYLTSNRDETYRRKPALLPQLHMFNNGAMIFPKDGDAGGSWITLCENGNAGVLLNGAFIKHEKKECYRKSRGLIFLAIMDSSNPIRNFQQHFLHGIEPFTLIIYQEHRLYECRWDEHGMKYYRSLSVNRPYIWSSSTIYNKATQIKRETWLQDWLKKYSSPEQDHILNFHRFGGDGNKGDDWIINRGEQVSTVSITSISVNNLQGRISYTDVANGYQSTSELSLNIEGFSNHQSLLF